MCSCECVKSRDRSGVCFGVCEFVHCEAHMEERKGVDEESECACMCVGEREILLVCSSM